MIKKKDKKKESSFFEFLKTIFYAVIIAVIFRSLFFEPYNIPSGSMLPNLLIGDYLFVSKYSYGYSRYSFPFGIVPLPENRVFASEPKRGDVAVFKLPSNTNINYIMRVMGLPVDKIQRVDSNKPLDTYNYPMGDVNVHSPTILEKDGAWKWFKDGTLEKDKSYSLNKGAQKKP